MTREERQQRIDRRAATLAADGYIIDRGEELGTYLVINPRGDEYTVRLYSDGSGDCTCPSLANNADLTCKHMNPSLKC